MILKAVPTATRAEMTQWEWLQYGIEHKFCSEVVCSTHDGLPSTDEEDAQWEAGEDPCVPAVRIYELEE